MNLLFMYMRMGKGGLAMGVTCAAAFLRDLKEEFRTMAHKKLDEWVDALESEFSKDPSPTLKGLSEVFQGTRSHLLSGFMEAAIARLYPDYIDQQWAHCPQCNTKVHRKRFEPKEISTMQGRFTLNRPYFYCIRCQHGFYPLDEVIKMAPQRHQYDIQERVTTTAARLPFEESAELFGDLTGVELGNHFSHETLNAVGEVATVELVIPEAEEISRRVEQATDSTDQLPVLVIAADGAHAPTRPKAPRKAKRGKGSYKEAKGFRVYLLRQDDRICQIASWHQIGESEPIEEALKLLAHRVPQDKVRVVLTGDGASWVWNVMVKNFPDARQILDFYHCFEHLYRVANAQFGQGSLNSQQWAEATMVRLGDGEVDRVVSNLRKMKHKNSEAQEEIRKLIGYLESNAHRMGYFNDLAEGFPIGSGGVESANKFICHSRLKRSGAWWVKEMGNAMLRVRCALYNGTFDRVFNHYMEIQNASQTQCKRPNDE
jgi:hypothetical protein